MDHTFSDLYTRFCTGSEPSKYSARRAGSAVAFYRKTAEQGSLNGAPQAGRTPAALPHNPAGAYPQQPQGLVVILVPELQFTTFAPHTRQVVHLLEAHLGGLLQDDAGLPGQAEARLKPAHPPLRIL